MSRDTDPDRIGVTEGELTVDDRIGQGDIDTDRIGVTGAIQTLLVLQGVTGPQRTEVGGRKL